MTRRLVDPTARSGMIVRVFVSLLIIVVAASGVARAEDDKVLNIYNWSDYIADDTVSRFEAETGIKVHYDVYDSNEVLEAKLLAGHSGYDLVVPSASPFMARQIEAGVYQKVDKANLSHYGNLDPQILAAVAAADPGNEYGVPPAEVRARLFFDKPVTPQYERRRTRAWTKVKTGS